MKQAQLIFHQSPDTRREVQHGSVVPRRLYKYRSLRGDNRDHTLHAISHTEVYFCHPSQFNDPYDCGLNVKGASTEEMAQMDAKTQEISVFCLSECNDNLLMWSHYADDHKGVCIEYSPINSVLFGCSLTPVSYQEKYPEFSISEEPDLEWTAKYLSTKSKDWKYEREWRIFYREHGVKAAPSEELTAIIMGCEISTQDREDILSLVRLRSTPTLLYQAVRDNNAFRLRTEAVVF